jgi:hypothetical protein
MVKILGSLATPPRIQDFVDGLHWNHSRQLTANSVVRVMEDGAAHCFEGALVAAAALWLAGHPPLLVDMGAEKDDDHVLAVFRHGRYWGAISKSNSAFLRYRDPIHRSLRELAISYFPNYMRSRRKTLRTYSVPVDLQRVDPRLWVTRRGFCAEVIDLLTTARHFDILPRGMGANSLRPIDPIVTAAARLREHPPATAG